jgi:hypothetical protein
VSDDLSEFDPLDPDATLSGYEGLSAANVEQVALRRRMLTGDEEGVDIVERLRFHAERQWLSPGRAQWPLMVEAAELIEQLRARVAK